MGIYDPLREYLRHQNAGEVILSFSEIETIIGRRLPKTAERPPWWANRILGRSPQRDAWRDAGYEAYLIRWKYRVRFVRAS